MTLDEFAAQVEAASVWTFSMNQQLATLVGGTVKNTDAFDSVFRLRPKGWRIGMGEDPVDPKVSSVNLYQWDGWHPQGCVVTANGNSLLLGLIAATARAYAARDRCAGNKPSNGVIMVASHVMVRTAGMGGLPPVGSIVQVMSEKNEHDTWQLEGGGWTDGGNLCQVISI